MLLLLIFLLLLLLLKLLLMRVFLLTVTNILVCDSIIEHSDFGRIKVSPHILLFLRRHGDVHFPKTFHALQAQLYRFNLHKVHAVSKVRSIADFDYIERVATQVNDLKLVESREISGKTAELIIDQ